MPAYENWNRSATSTPRVSFIPRTVGEVVDAVRKVSEYPSPMRAAGERHSTTLCFAADDGTQVFMDHFKDIDVNGSRVTAGAGATMLEIRDRLRPSGRELAVAPEIGNATAGSVACSGTKDSTLDHRTARDLAQIGSLVVEVEMVDAQGRRIRVRDDGAKDLDTDTDVPGLDLGLVRCSYGLLGIIYKVTFATLELVPLRNRFEWISLWDTSRNPKKLLTIAEIFDGADAVLGFLQPYQGPEGQRGKILVERRRRLEPAEGLIREEDRIKRAFRDWMWEWGAHVAPTYIPELAKALRQRSLPDVYRVLAESLVSVLVAVGASPLFQAFPLAGLQGLAHAAIANRVEEHLGAAGSVSPEELLSRASRLLLGGASVGGKPSYRPIWALDLLDLLPGPVLGSLGEYRAYRSDSLIDFTRERDTFFDFTFWAFPQAEWPRLIPEYLEFCERYERQHAFRPTLFTEVYFIGEDHKSMLSVSDRGPVFTLDVVDSHPSDPAWRAMNHAYNHWASDHGGRPLFNQTKHLESTPSSRQLIRQAFGAGMWAEFSRRIWAANPPLPNHPRGRFVSPYFETLLDPR